MDIRSLSKWASKLLGPHLFLLPPLFIVAYFFQEKGALEERYETFAHVARKARLLSSKAEAGKRFAEIYAQANPRFLEEKIEPMSFLEEETTLLKTVLSDPIFENAPELTRRLEKLENNTLRFGERSREVKGPFTLITYAQLSPIEVNEGDLARILSAIEGVEITPHLPLANRPALVIKSMKLSKEKNYHLQMELLAKALNE